MDGGDLGRTFGARVGANDADPVTSTGLRLDGTGPAPSRRANGPRLLGDRSWPMCG